METPALLPERIKSQLATRLIGRRLHYFHTVDSTNHQAKQLAARGAPEGSLIITDLQTAGKGRLGRRWTAPVGTGLLFSLIFRPALAPVHVSQLTMLCSLAAAEAIQQRTGLEVRIKWPNDLVIPYPASNDYKKLAGLLTESSLLGDKLLFSVVGVGINVNLDPADLGEMITPATSLMAELGRPVDREALLCAILQQIESRYLPLNGRQIHADWSQRLITLGQNITVSTPAGQHQGMAESVDSDGTLYLRDLAGNLQPIMIGDVSLRPTKAKST